MVSTGAFSTAHTVKILKKQFKDLNYAEYC